MGVPRYGTLFSARWRTPMSKNRAEKMITGGDLPAPRCGSLCFAKDVASAMPKQTKAVALPRSRCGRRVEGHEYFAERGGEGYTRGDGARREG